MMELLIFDRQFNFLGLVDNFTSFIKVKKYNDAGSFELHLAFSLDVLELLELDNIVWQKGDDEAGFIETRNIKVDATGQEEIVITGRPLTAYLDRRIVWKRENIYGKSEKIMRQLVNNNAINPIIADRTIPLLELGTDKGLGDTTRRQATYSNLLGVLHQVANKDGLGFRVLVEPQAKKLEFDVYAGVDLSKKVMFSRQFENILGQEYFDGMKDFRNTALIAGVGEGEERKITFIEKGVGLDRFELHVDAKDIADKITVDEVEVPITPEEYNELLNGRGNEKLAEKQKAESFASKINLKSNILYKADFNLGDIVTVVDKRWGLQMDVRIMEIIEVYEEDGFNVDIVFGNEPIGLIEKIKRAVE